MTYELWIGLAGLIVNIALIGVAIMAPGLPSRRNRIYNVLLIISLVGNIIGLLQHTYLSFVQNVSGTAWRLMCACSFLQFFAIEAVVMVYVLYVNSLFGILVRNKIQAFLLYFGWIFTVIVMILGFMIPKFFYFDVDGAFHLHRPWGILLFIQYIWYIPHGISSVWRRRRKLATERLFAFGGFFLIILFDIPVLTFTHSMSIVMFMMAATLLFVEFTFQNPSEDADIDTGFWNKNAFMFLIDAAMGEKNEIDVVAIKMENLSILRNQLGNGNMDELLRQLRSYFHSLSPDTQICRIQNDAIALIMPSNYKREEILRQIVGRFRNPWKVGNTYKTLFIRTCILCCPEDAENAEDAFSLISLMMAEASSQEKEIIHLSEMNIPNRKRIGELDSLVRKALDENWFEVYYQPIYTPETDSYYSAEALLRLKTPEEGFISPAEFIPIAERNGTILQIDQFVLEEVCRLLEETEATAFGIKYIEVNLSVVECLQSNLAEQVEATLAKHGVAHEQINLEITESAESISDMIMENILRIAQKNFVLSIDDFGTGYSNVMRIVDMPISIVKLDKTLVTPALHSKRAYEILSDIIRMNHEMGFETVAEGVETAGEAAMVTKMGTEHIQGFYYAKPMPKKEFIEFLREHRTGREQKV